jgi:hypothetical protein
MSGIGPRQHTGLMRPNETRNETRSETGPVADAAGPPSRAVHSAAEPRSDLHKRGVRRLAEDTRFELVRGCPQHAFQACALGR